MKKTDEQSEVRVNGYGDFMTDRIHSLTIVLDKNYRDDDVESIVNAIKMIRGVLSVSLYVSNLDSHMAEERAKHELGQKLMKIIYP